MRRYEALRKANITHVVSALALPLDRDLYASYKHLVIELDDMDDEDIIQHFATSNAFIKDGLENGGGVLVHWYVQAQVRKPMSTMRSYSQAISSFRSSGVVIHLTLSSRLDWSNLNGSCHQYCKLYSFTRQLLGASQRSCDPWPCNCLSVDIINAAPESSNVTSLTACGDPVPWESHDPRL